MTLRPFGCYLNHTLIRPVLLASVLLVDGGVHSVLYWDEQRSFSYQFSSHDIRRVVFVATLSGEM